MAAGQRAGEVNRVLLLTDGLANVGITDPETLTGLCQSAAEVGITTTTIGFGAGYDENLLTAMARAGGGNDYYIEHADQAPGVFEEELEGLLSISAQNLSVRIEPTAGNECAQVWHEYPSQAEGDALVLTVGDLYAREPRHVLAEFLLKPAEDGEEEAEIDVATFTVTADVLTEEGSVEKHTVTLPVRLSPVEGGYAEPSVRKEMLHIEVARAREEALEDWKKGEYDRAQQNLRSVGVGIMNSPHAGRRAAGGGRGPRPDGRPVGRARRLGGGPEVHAPPGPVGQDLEEEGGGAGVEGEAGRGEVAELVTPA